MEPNSGSPPPAPDRRQAVRSLLLGGILPVVAFTLVEEYYGTLWGLVAGMALGVFEIAAEWIKQRRVDTITWIGNGLILVMGGISLFTNEGIWFKLQPAIIELATAGLMFGSVIMGKPFLVMMAHKQNLFARIRPEMTPVFVGVMRGLTLRIGIFFLAHSVLATWAAYAWSTRAWAILKGVGFTLSLVAYLVAEMWWMRKKLASAVPPASPPYAGSSK